MNSPLPLRIQFKPYNPVMVKRKSVVIVVIIVFGILGILTIQQCTPKQNSKVEANQYVGDQSCKSCHKSQYNEWLSSDHFKAMQVAADSTVLGNFNNQVLVADGVTTHFFKRNGKYFINTEDEKGTYHDYEIRYTFGYKPLQQYLVEFPGGRMQVTRQSWDTKNNKWFQQYTGHKIPPHDWLHWTGGAQNWNTMCASCHSTNLQKNYNLDSQTYHTTYSSLTVSCESCHGAGKNHIQYINSSDYKGGNKVSGSYLLMAKNVGQGEQINTCAPCHMRGTEINDRIASASLLDNYIPEIPSSEHFYADGQAKDEDYSYTSFLQSKMYSRGVKCSNCHNPHTGRVLFTSNQLCLQCHAKKYDDYSHTFHTMGTEASGCKSCHMPGTYYMGNDLRHDHAFRVPRPDLSVKYGTPNACNKCHSNQTASWAANAVNKWYGSTRAYHFAEDLIPASKEDGNTEKHVIRLMNDSAIPAIVKATALHYLKNIATENSLKLLLQGLSHPDPQVRYHALKSLSDFPAEEWVTSVAPLLKDKIRAVRIAAADLMITVPASQRPQEYEASFLSAKNELEKFVLHLVDFSEGSVMAADYYFKLQDYPGAEKFYTRSLQIDSALNYARLNLSVVYNLTGRNDKALNTLLDALKSDPKNDRIYFNMALLYNEMNNPLKAGECLAKAVALYSNNPRVYYNYGLLLQQQGKLALAEKQLERAVELSPMEGDLNYALALLYIQRNELVKARQTGEVLKKYYPANPEYQPLLQQLGL
jgi:tetratricopeptide (TPR) repeat protein